MTVAVIWQEEDLLWCAADSRLVVEPSDQTVTEMATKIYSIPVVVHAQDQEGYLRDPHYWTQYGFVYAGSAAAASMTAVTAATLLQQLARQGGRISQPRFEEVAKLVKRLAHRFIRERRDLGGDGSFWCALFGWCHHEGNWQVAYISPQEEIGNFRVELQYPKAPKEDGAPWLVLGTGRQHFIETHNALLAKVKGTARHVPRLAIEQMIRDGLDRTVGGTVSTGAAHRNGFVLFHSEEEDPLNPTQVRRIFNGLDLDRDVGDVIPYRVATHRLP